MSTSLTPRQSEILALIRSTLETEGRPPTRAEIASAFGFRSINAAEEHLKALARKGAIELSEGRARGIRLCGEEGLPVVGRVAAGQPILASENIERHVPVSAHLFAAPPDYFLRVRGESMRDAGILDGDLIAVAARREARTGQIVVARIGDDVTVKRLELKSAGMRLLPENPDFAPITPDPAEVVIEGVVVGLLRDGSGGWA